MPRISESREFIEVYSPETAVARRFVEKAEVIENYLLLTINNKEGAYAPIKFYFNKVKDLPGKEKLIKDYIAAKKAVFNQNLKWKEESAKLADLRANAPDVEVQKTVDSYDISTGKIVKLLFPLVKILEPKFNLDEYDGVTFLKAMAKVINSHPTTELWIKLIYNDANYLDIDRENKWCELYKEGVPTSLYVAGTDKVVKVKSDKVKPNDNLGSSSDAFDNSEPSKSFNDIAF